MTTAENYYEMIKDMGVGQLLYLTRKSDEEFVFESVIIDTAKQTETINRLKRVMLDPNFIALPGTPEMYKFLEEDGGNSENK